MMIVVGYVVFKGWSQRKSSSLVLPFESEQAFAQVDHVAVLEHVIHAGLQDLDLPVGISAMDAQALFGAALSQTTAGGEGLDDGHVAFEAHGTRALHFTIDVDHRHPVHIDGVAIDDHRVVGLGRCAEQVGQVDDHAERAVVAHAAERHQVAATRGNPASGGEQLAQAHARLLDREAAWAVDHAEHGGLVATDLRDQDADLRLAHEIAVAQSVGDDLLGLGHGQPAQLDLTEQREADAAAFGHARFQRQIGVLIHAHADHIARPEHVVTLGIGHLRPGQRGCHQGQEGKKHAPEEARGVCGGGRGGV